jgi:hypothetical protein
LAFGHCGFEMEFRIRGQETEGGSNPTPHAPGGARQDLGQSEHVIDEPLRGCRNTERRSVRLPACVPMMLKGEMA